MDDLSLVDAFAAFDLYNGMTELEPHHLFDKLVTANGLLSEVADQLSMQDIEPEMLGMVKAAEQLTDFLIITFQSLVPNDSSIEN